MINLTDPIIISKEEATRIKAFGTLVICGLTFALAGWAGNKVFEANQGTLIRQLNEAQLKYDILASKSDPFAVIMAEREYEQEVERENKR
jgi:hypothetical protein